MSETTMVCACGDGSCMLCDDDGMVPIVTSEPYDREGTPGRACRHCNTAWPTTECDEESHHHNVGCPTMVVSTVSAADLIASGVDVASQDDQCDDIVTAVDDLIKSEGEEGESTARMVRAILRTLRDAADSAIDLHQDDPESSSIARVRRASAHLTAALAELSS